jgi:prepilin-type processing-associated H-X9-DG protein
LNNIGTYQHYHDSFGLKGIIPGASQLWIIADNQITGELYYPDQLDNHKSDGANVGFCDGHVAWISRQRYVQEYEISQDEGRTSRQMTF